MKLFCYGDDVPDRPCCSLDSINDARRVCQQLGVPHYVLNLEGAFGRDVIDNFVQEYARGRTPIPCVRCNTFTKFFFACLGQIGFDACPSIPPEVVLLPRWFYFNLYHVSAWTRTMILPLGIVTTFRYTRSIRPEQGIRELYLDPAAANRLANPPPRGIPTDWRDAFLRLDQVLKWYEKRPILSLRNKAMREAERWLLEHLDGSEGLGAIFPPMVYILIVFRALGYADDHPRVVAAHRHLDDLFIREGDAIRIQPCLSPVWDTAIAMHALAESGLSPTSDAARRATQWLLAKECTVASDWKKNCPGAETGGWFFEFENRHYPDVDDTAMVSMALKRLGGAAASAATTRGIQWILAMQNDDGGWAAFDKTKHRPLLEKIPFADHNAMQDPSCPDITGRVLEMLGHCGFTTADGRHRVRPLAPGRGRELVGPLGRQLPLRHLADPHRLESRRRGHDAALRAPRRRVAQERAKE